MEKDKVFENCKTIYQIVSEDRQTSIKRVVKETGATASFRHYTFIDRKGNSIVKRIDNDIAEEIIKEALKDDNLSSALVVIEDPEMDARIDFEDKALLENLYTSTGDKFKYHQNSIKSYKQGNGKTIISTHISPEGRCNLKCPYCSVAYRTTFDRIEFDTIKKYIGILKERGLQAVILTGGGEPTLYPQINELIEMIHGDYGLDLAMITNGTTLDRIHPSNRNKFQWLRVSVNIFKGWEEKLKIPAEFIASDTVIGFSYIMTCEHDFTEDAITQKEIISKIIKLMDRSSARYLRLLPNCLVKGKKFNYQHKAIDNILSFFRDKRIFHQLKTHEIPGFEICYQSYFRPYLSEERNPWNGEAGCVFPCDSVVLNDSIKRFDKKFALCEPDRIGEYLDHKIKPNFTPPIDCHGCVFVNNNKLIKKHISNFSSDQKEALRGANSLHKNFV